MAKENNFIEKLYDIADSNTSEGLSAFDEAKLKRSMEGSNLMSRNDVMFAKHEPKFRTCKMYNPCPLCHKCLNKASHLYVRCQTCKIPICVHTHEDRARLLRRENFALTVTNETKKVIKELGDKI